MRRDIPEPWTDEVSYDALCQFCNGLLMEMDPDMEVFITSRGWLCANCYVDGGKRHCLPRPYKLPIRVRR